MARNTYAGPVETGRLAIRAPQNGPRDSATAEADTTSRAVVKALTRGGNQMAAVIGYGLPPARRTIQAALRQDSAAGCQVERHSIGLAWRRDAGAGMSCQGGGTRPEDCLGSPRAVSATRFGLSPGLAEDDPMMALSLRPQPTDYNRQFARKRCVERFAIPLAGPGFRLPPRHVGHAMAPKTVESHIWHRSLGAPWERTCTIVDVPPAMIDALERTRHKRQRRCCSVGRTRNGRRSHPEADR